MCLNEKFFLKSNFCFNDFYYGYKFVFYTRSFCSKEKEKMTPEEIQEISNMADKLLKKVYAAGLFSPKDNENLITTKLKLDEALLGSPNPEFASIYYKLGYIYSHRELKDDSIQCFQTILDNFSDSPYAVRAVNELKKMGVNVVTPGNTDSSSK